MDAVYIEEAERSVLRLNLNASINMSMAPRTRVMAMGYIKFSFSSHMKLELVSAIVEHHDEPEVHYLLGVENFAILSPNIQIAIWKKPI